MRLPRRFEELSALLEAMPYVTADGRAGLLAQGNFGDESWKIPELKVDDIKDTTVLSALFRDYTFWASAYLLEPCHLNLLRQGSYGMGRQTLPRNIAMPLATVARKLNMKPFMEYALSYALYNWKRKEPTKPIQYDNLELIRTFTGSLNEAGFILVHVAMVANTTHLVRATLSALDACEKKDRRLFNAAIHKFQLAMRAINQEMETMWRRSDPDDYKNFRTFIMGTKNQPMFPNGVIYEGVSPEPLFFRGESGANDSIIPTADNLFQIYDRMPENPLTSILRDFRSYRPRPHGRWLEMVHRKAQAFRVRAYALQERESALLMLECLDEVRDFRQRHWNFAKEYIIKHSNHPVATGGSPIVTWLPNQLSTLLDLMNEVVQVIRQKYAKEAREGLMQRLHTVEERLQSQDNILKREVRTLRTKFRDQ